MGVGREGAGGVGWGDLSARVGGVRWGLGGCMEGGDCVGVMGGGALCLLTVDSSHAPVMGASVPARQLTEECASHGHHPHPHANPLPSLHAPFIPPTPIHPPTTRPAVAAGVPQRMLLDWLAEYRYAKNPSGWILPAQSWFIDQVRQSTPASTLLLLLNGPIMAH